MTRLKALIMAALAAPLLVLSLACSTPSTPAGPQAQEGGAKSVPAPTAPVTAFADGTYTVGSAAGQVRPGKYTTTAPGDGLGCYWARLKGFGGEIDDIRANGNIGPGAPGVVTIVAADKGFTVSGGCTWRLT